MAHVLAVSALELRHPLAFVVLMEPDDPALHLLADQPQRPLPAVVKTEAGEDGAHDERGEEPR